MHRQPGPFGESAVVGESVEIRRPRPGDALRAGAESGRPAASAPPEAPTGRGWRRPATCSPITLIVSVTGVPGTAAPQRSAGLRSRGRSDRAPAKGRAASWTRTMSGARSARASRPLRTESCRVSPPWTHGRSADAGVWQGRKGCFIQVPVVGMDHHDRPVDARVGEERRERPGENRLALERPVLLRDPLPGSRSTSCGNDEGGN